MSTEVDHELKTAFELASEYVRPHPDLAERARQGVRRRRRRTLAAAAASTAAVLAIAVITYAAAASYRDTATGRQADSGSPRVLATVGYQVTQLTVSGRYLYVLAGDNSMLTAYDRATGNLIRQIALPDGAVSLALGPGGSLWLASDQIWLLSPDLRLHSAYAGLDASTIVPAGPTTALIPTQHGLVSVRLPAPGRSGQASQRLEPHTSLGPVLNTAPGFWSGQLGDRTAVYVTNGGGNDGHLVLAGSPGLRFGGSSATHISAIAFAGTSLWVTTYAQRDGESSLEGPLVRLNSRLADTTPAAVQSSPALARAESVWSAGHTIWVATGMPGHSLVCFAAGREIGVVATMPVRGEVVALAATAGTIYVNALQPPGSYGPSRITIYPIPAACR